MRCLRGSEVDLIPHSPEKPADCDYAPDGLGAFVGDRVMRETELLALHTRRGSRGCSPHDAADPL